MRVSLQELNMFAMNMVHSTPAFVHALGVDLGEHLVQAHVLLCILYLHIEIDNCTYIVKLMTS